MAVSASLSDRVRRDGKFFRLGARRFHVKGVTYGPFAPDAQGQPFASPEQTKQDFLQINELGVNLLRLYYAPPAWFLDLATEHGLKVLIDVPWAKHLCFLDSRQARSEARRKVREAVRANKGHPAVFAHSVANEVPAEIVRWSGVVRVQQFLGELITEAKTVDPDCLYTFTSFPPTEFLRVEGTDFISFNVYLHDPKSFDNYLARLQTLAADKPLVLGEFGMDSIREGEAAKCEFLKWQIELACRSGLAGTVVFSFTDDWFRGGLQIEDWGFGLTRRDRQPKESFRVVQRQYQIAPYFPLPRKLKTSVVVASFNGARTLENCLESLSRLNYPDYEVILVDDGSRDQTPEIAKRFPAVRYVRQQNQGLSVARNTGIRAATGEIVAFTDDDCRANEDWLYYLVQDLLRGNFTGIGGHNFLPPEDSCVAAAVVVSPGGPAHVMLTDREAEHIPGCNMAFYKWALEQVGLFDPVYRKAGDDVDVCWRLEDTNLRIGFSHAGFVWHYRRPTIKAYLKQQAGYGEAEAMLIGKHPEHFSSFGGGIWRGRIYAASSAGLLLRSPVIYHGIFGTGFFQRLYAPAPFQPLLLFTSLGYHVFITVPLSVLAGYFSVFLPLAITSFSLSLAACALAAAQADLPTDKIRFWSRPLVALLFFLQPIVRGWARFKGRMTVLSGSKPVLLPERVISGDFQVAETIAFWSSGAVNRCRFLGGILSELQRAGWPFETDAGWSDYDLEIPATFWTRVRLTTVSEELEKGSLALRCRVHSYWSLAAKVMVAVAGIGTYLLITNFAEAVPWVWLSLLSLPLVCWVADDQRSNYESALADLVATAAKRLSLVPLGNT